MLQSEGAEQHITSTMEPIAIESSRLFGGPEAQKAAGSCGSADASALVAERFQDMQVAAAELSSLLVFWHVQRSVLAQWHAELAPELEGDAAWRHVVGRVAPTEEMLVKIDTALRASISGYSRHAGDGPGSEAERTWLEEIFRARTLQQELVARALLLLARSRKQSIEGYIHTAALLLDFMVAYTAMVMSNLALRQTWMERILEEAAAGIAPGSGSAASTLAASTQA